LHSKYEQYVSDGLVHLTNAVIYQQLSADLALQAVLDLQEKIEEWLEDNEHIVPDMAQRYIQKHMTECMKSPFGQFYLMYKIHKGKKNGQWPTRPVCSDVSSISHGLGKWVTEQLMPVARAQKSYFKDSFELKAMLDKLVMTPNARFWKADAQSMYTFIDTPPALAENPPIYEQKKGSPFTTTDLRH
jgi:hypothetical protein